MLSWTFGVFSAHEGYCLLDPFLSIQKRRKRIHTAVKTKDQGVDVRGVLGLIFAGYVPLASQSSYPIIVYSVANDRLHLCQFWANM